MAAGVLIVEDDDFTRMLLRSQVEQFGFEVVADTASVAKALELARTTRPAVALLDLDLGRGPTGIDLAHGLRRLLPSVGIVLLTSYADTRLTGETRALPPQSIKLVKRTLGEPTMLESALRTAADPELRTALASSLASSPRAPLTDGQAEILRLVANGFSNAEIAKRRHVSESAVIKAVSRLVDQLGLTHGAGDNQRILLTQAFYAMAGTTVVRRD